MAWIIGHGLALGGVLACLGLCALLAPAAARADAVWTGVDMEFNQSVVESMMNYLSRLQTEVAAKKPLSLRDSPGVVTLITAEEIQNSGARDLVDVLRMVPGIEFASDALGVVGLTIRGNW